MSLDEKILQIQNNISLQEFTTLKLGGICTNFYILNDESYLPLLVKWSKLKKNRILILGGGSNVVISDNIFDGLVLKVEIKGIELIKSSEEYVLLHVGAGVIWDEFVEYTVFHGYWGAENMSLIPGTVGAIPIQNVGAYGQEASQIVASVKVYDRINEKFKILSNKDCQFSLRHSIFNDIHKNRYIITSVDFKLYTAAKPNLRRVDVQKKFDELYTGNKNSQQILIRKSIIELRSSGKNLPLSDTDFNTGTFFQAVIMKKSDFYSIFFRFLLKLKLKVSFKVLLFRIKFSNSTNFKIPSNFLINTSSCKNLISRNKNFKLFENNSTVLIHNGKGSAEELSEYIMLLRNCVFNETGLFLPVEPEFYGIDKIN